MTDDAKLKDACPHCGHKYWFNFFVTCPSCDLPHDAPAGTLKPRSPEAAQATVAAVAALPVDERSERLLREIVSGQQQMVSRQGTTNALLGVLVLFVVVIPIVLWLIWG